MKVITSSLIWAVGVIITAANYFASITIKYLPLPIKDREKLLHAQCFWWSDALIAMNPFWKIRIDGLENIDHSRTYVIVANHQSLADIIIIYQLHMYFKWVAKKELLKLPFIGGLLALNNHIMLSREALGSIKDVYREAISYLRKGIPVLFFPEGTRRDTDEMGEFKNGAFKLAIKEKIPVLPVFIGGTREAIPKGGWIFNTKVSGRLVVLPPIDTSTLGVADFAKLRDMVKDQLEAIKSRA